MTGDLYSFDTSAFINGRRDLLPPEVFPTIWSRIQDSIGIGTIRAVDVVRDEIRKRDDQIKTWAEAQTDLFLDLDEDIQRSTRLVLQDHPKLMGTGGGRNAADPFVIGLARHAGGVVVSEETLSGRIDKPRIPDVCAALGIPCVTLVGFIRLQGWTF